MKKPYTRKATYNEHLFLAADAYRPPVANQFFIEGTGVLDHNKWQAAVEKASAANPGTRLRLKGHLGWSKWIDSGITPPVIEVDGSNWSGTGPDGAPFLMKQLNPRDSHTCEVLLIHGPTQRIAFRTHHAVTDGRGTFTWIEDIFRVLNSLEPLGSTSTLSDLELVRSIRKEYRTPFPFDNLAPAGKAEGDEGGVTWKRVEVQGRFKNFLGQIAVLAAKEARKHGSGPVRFSVPVDLRRHMKGARSTCNLSMAIYIEVKPDSTPQDISDNISRQLELNNDCLIDRLDPLFRYVPQSLITSQLTKRVRKIHQKGLYTSSGVITNLGSVQASAFSGGGFKGETAWAIPPGLDASPFVCGMISSRENQTMIILTMPRVLATNNRMDIILENITGGLIPA